MIEVYALYRTASGETRWTDAKLVRDGQPVRLTDFVQRNLIRLETLRPGPDDQYNPATGSYTPRYFRPARHW